ncbi:isochorismatase family cysteine hydrolase [Piscinibacter sakaiensis]|uniref:isochorismatase family cysteine hydrolase n=1 Tax=Piscinibacter sakaiensis TaxID=1547922 RepID=UPI003AAF6B31
MVNGKSSGSSRRKLRDADMPSSPTVLLLVDFVNPLDFPGAEKLAPAAAKAAKATAKLRRQLSRQGVRTVYANDNYGNWNADLNALWKSCAAKRGYPAEIARALKPRKDDLTILKPRHSAFYATALDILLEQLKCKKLVLAGVAADSCVLFTAMDAYLRGYSVRIPSDCVAAEEEQATQAALEHMARVLKADISPAEDRRKSRGDGGPN